MRKAKIWLVLLLALATVLWGALAEEIDGYTSDALFAEEAEAGVTADAAGLEIYFFDLGRVDGILIRCEGVDSFIDVGFASDATPALQYMKGLGVTHLDSYICSHAHADHIEGGPAIIKALGADKIYAPHKQCFTALAEFSSNSQLSAVKKAKGIVVKAGSSFQIGGATVYCYGPVSVTRCSTGSQKENANSLLLKLVYGERSFMFTGDATANEILLAGRKYPGKLKVDVLKNPHHNGKLDPDVAKVFSPKVTVFCTANENQPAREYLRTLKSMGSKYYITGSNHDGNIKLSTDGHNLQLTRGYPLSRVKLNAPGAMFPGQKVTLSGSIRPAKYAKQAAGWLCWTSSDTSVAKISGGKVQAVGEGTATLSATSINGATSSVEVQVFGYGAALNKRSMTMAVGDSAMLKYKLGPGKPEGADPKWVASDESVAFVTDEGEVIAVSSGKVRIGVELANGFVAQCAVTVTETQVKKVTLNKEKLNLSVGDTATLKAKLTPSDATNRNVKWASSNESVATVDAFGNVTAVGKGSAKIGALAASGKFAVCQVRVK